MALHRLLTNTCTVRETKACGHAGPYRMLACLERGLDHVDGFLRDSGTVTTFERLLGTRAIPLNVEYTFLT